MMVKSLARPGANGTGMANFFGDLLATQIELLAEIMPKMSRIALLNDSGIADPQSV